MTALNKVRFTACYTFCLLMLVVPNDAFSKWIGHNAEDTSSYYAAERDQNGNVKFQICPRQANFSEDCDPDGNSSWVNSWKDFENNLKKSYDFDKVLEDTYGNIKISSREIAWLENEIVKTQNSVELHRKEIESRDEKSQELHRLIEKANQKLNDKNLSESEKSDLKKFIDTANDQISELNKENSEAEKTIKAELLIISQYQTKLHERQVQREFLYEKVTEQRAHIRKAINLIPDILAGSKITESFQNEMIYTLITSQFQKNYPGFESKPHCWIKFKPINGLSEIEGQILLYAGVHSQKLSFAKSGETFDLFDGQTIHLKFADLRNSFPNSPLKAFFEPENYANLYTYSSLTSNEVQKCSYGGGFEEVVNQLRGPDVHPNRGRSYYNKYHLFYMGLQSHADVGDLCWRSGMSVGAYDDYYGTYRLPSEFDSKKVISKLKVENNPLLGSGYFSWGSASEPKIVRFSGGRAVFTDYSESKELLWSMKLPLLCYQFEKIYY